MTTAPDDRIPISAAVGLGALVLATFVAITTEVVPIGLLPQLSRAFAVSESVTGLLVTVYAALVALLAVPLSRLTGRLPRKPLLIGTIALYAVGNLMIALAPSFALVCVGRAVGGVAHALFFSTCSAYASALVPERVQGRALAIAASGVSLGYILGVPFVTSIGAAVDWRAAFVALAVGGVFSGGVCAVLLPAVGASSPVPSHARNPVGALVGAAAVNALSFFGHYALYTYISALYLAAGLPEGTIAALLFVLGAAGVIGLWLAGLVIDRRPRAGFLGALLLSAAAIAALAVVGAHPVGVIVCTVLWLIGFGAIPVFSAAACLRSRVLSLDLSAAVNNAASNVGIGGGAAVGGVVFATSGLPAVIGVGAVAIAVSAVLVLLLRRAFPVRAYAAAGPVRP